MDIKRLYKKKTKKIFTTTTTKKKYNSTAVLLLQFLTTRIFIFFCITHCYDNCLLFCRCLFVIFYFGFGISRTYVILTSIFFKKIKYISMFLMKLVLNTFVVSFILLKIEIFFSHAEKVKHFIVSLQQNIILQNISSRSDAKAKNKNYFNYFF